MVIYERNDKFLNFLTPALVSFGGSPLLIALQIIISIPLIGMLINLPEFSDPLYTPIWNCIFLFFSQILGAILISYLVIPRFNIKEVKKSAISRVAFMSTILIICLVWALIIIKTFMLIFSIEFLNLEEPISGVAETLVPEEELITPLTLIIIFAPIIIGAPLFEELVYRRLLIPLLEERGMTSMNAIIVSSLFFTILHAPTDLIHGNLTGAITHFSSVIILAFALGFSYVKTRNVLYPMIIHGSLNGISSLSIIIISYPELETLIGMFSFFIIGFLGFIYGIFLIIRYLRDFRLSGWKNISRTQYSINPNWGILGFYAISLGLLTFENVAMVIIPELSILILPPLFLIGIWIVISNTKYFQGSIDVGFQRNQVYGGLDRQGGEAQE